MSLLDLRGVAHSFGGLQAVDDVSLSIENGETVALIGPNGAGKTTLFNLIHGLLIPNRGQIFFDECNVTDHPAQKRVGLGLARSFQIPRPFGSFTARENVLLALEGTRSAGWSLRRSPTPDMHVQANTALEEVQLAKRADTLAMTLSYGEKKRLEIAMALAPAPRLLLLDEPTAGLGLGEGESLLADIAVLARRRGVTLLFIEHDMKSVFSIAQRILVLHRGRLIADGIPAEVRANAAVRAAYLGDAA